MDENNASDVYMKKLKNNREGATELNARKMANTRKGYRRSADSPIVKLAISEELLMKAGYTFFLDYYSSVVAYTWEPPHRTVCTVVLEVGAAFSRPLQLD